MPHPLYTPLYTRFAQVLQMMRHFTTWVFSRATQWIAPLRVISKMGSQFSRRLLLIAALGVIGLVMVGCEGVAAPQETGELPTIIAFPTDPPTNTAAPSPTLTDTTEPTDAPSPTLTLTLTRTIQPTPTQTLTPTRTFTPRTTPTFTLTFTFTPPPVTNTPVVVPTSDTPQVISFQASNTTAVGGGTINLTWEAIGDVVRIDRLNQLSQVMQTFSVTPIGELLVTIPSNEGSTIVYRLVVARGTREVTQTLTITVSGGAVNCPINWFFGNQFAPPAAGCPPAAPTQVNGAYQPFQTGRMIYLQTQNIIYTLVDPGGVTTGSMTQVPNGWDNTTTYSGYSGFSGCTQPIPVGLFEPQQMFAWNFCTGLGPAGTWVASLGYPTAVIDTSVRNLQTDASGNLYLDVPGGSVYQLVPVPAGQLSTTWTKIK